jgi:PAS domain S-box-containing protein
MRKPPFAFLLLTLAYVVSGRLGLMLAVPPGYATAIFPPAGIAVAAMLVAGRATLPWTFLGSFLLNLWTGYEVAQRLDSSAGAPALVIAAASTVQAALAGGAMRRWLGVPTPLDNSRDLVRFLALSPLCCMTSATLSLSGLSVLGVIDPSALIPSWVTWWIGDTLAVLLVLPLMLVLAGEPRTLWRRRTLPVAAPMLLFAALFIAIFAWSTTWGSGPALLESWSVLAAGVFCTGLLGALLMLGTGQAHRTERLVEKRTGDLRIALEELQATEANFRALYNKAPAPQHSLDAEGNIVGVSDYWLELMGYAREEVIGRPITAFLSPLSAERCRRSRPKFLAQGDETAQEFEFVKRSGEIVETIVARRVERDTIGQVVRTLGVVTDMTARREAERERDRLFEIAQDLIFIRGFDGTVRDVNPAFEAVLGYRRDDIIGTPYIDFVHLEDRAQVQARTEQLLAGETLPFNEIRCRHRDGSWRWISWRPIAVPEEGLL